MVLTMKDQRKIDVIQAVMEQRVSVGEGAMLLQRSTRTIFRMMQRWRAKGIKAMVHGNRGRKSLRKVPERIHQQILALARQKYANINDTHLKEILQREDGIIVGRSTLRRILREAGIAPKRKRRPSKYRSRRERKEAFGMMLQIDASPHDWLEGRGPWLALVGAIDDATGYVWARFEEVENTWSYFHLMEEVFSSYGLPVSLYSDRHSIFHILKEPTIIEQLNNQRPLTQFGRSMEELGIRILKAWSPQAKGRIERLWGTLQDRLVVELRLAGVKTKEEANAVLRTFLPSFNNRFTVKAKRPKSFFRKPPSPSILERTLCLKETRIVNKDHTVSFNGLILQIPPSSRWRSIAGQKVQLLQLKDGCVEIIYKTWVVARFSSQAITRLVNNHKPEKGQFKYAA